MTLHQRCSLIKGKIPMFNVLETILYNVLALSMHCRMQSELLSMTLLSISKSFNSLLEMDFPTLSRVIFKLGRRQTGSYIIYRVALFNVIPNATREMLLKLKGNILNRR